MKLLFVNPSLRPEAPHRYLPVGLGYVVTAVKEAGFDFDLLDIDISKYTDDHVEKYLIESNFDVIAIGSIVTHYKWIKWFIHTAKQHNPGCKIIVGNSVGSSISEVLFAKSPVDIIIVNEADDTIIEVLNAINHNSSLGQVVEPIEKIPHNNGDFPACVKGIGIEGIVFRDQYNRIVNNGRRKAIKRIDDLPYPDWDIFDVDEYLKVSPFGETNVWKYPKEEAVMFPINTARGCVFKCTFCHYVFWNDPYRHRSPESVIGEIKRNQEKYGANAISFWDELTFHKLGPTEKFIDALLDADLGIHWTCAIRTDLIGKDIDDKGNEIPYERRLTLARKLVESGCVSVGGSLESGNDEILKTMNKRIKAEYFINQINIAREVGLVINTSLVIGYPEETKETIAETMKMCDKAKVYPSPGFLLPLPETGMWDYAIENGHITDVDKFLTDLTERQDIVLNMTKMSDKEIMDETLSGLGKLNKKFGNLNKGKLIKTGGYDKHSKHQNTKQQNKKVKHIVDNRMLKIVESDETIKESLNYATVSDTLK